MAISANDVIIESLVTKNDNDVDTEFGNNIANQIYACRLFENSGSIYYAARYIFLRLATYRFVATLDILLHS